MKLSIKELESLNIGTRITVKDRYRFIKRDTGNRTVWSPLDSTNWLSYKAMARKEITKVEVLAYTEVEVPSTILDEREKEYLNGIVKPFIASVNGIEKVYATDSEQIWIYVDGNEPIMLPRFTAGTMYKNMKKDKKYDVDILKNIII